MSTMMVTQTVTPQLITLAASLVRLAHPTDGSLGRALDKAGERLLTLPWRVDAGILQIASHSCPGQCHATDGDRCDCLTTRGVCWHRGAWHILNTLASTGIAPIAPLPLPAVLDEDELPGSFLDGPFDAFEDTRILGFDADMGDEWSEAVPRKQDAPARGAFYRGEYHSPQSLSQAAAARAQLPGDRGTFRPGPARVHQVDERAQALADSMFRRSA